MNQLQTSLRKVNAWQVRIIALAFIVLSVGGGSHMLVNAFAADAGTDVQTTYISTNTTITIPMHSISRQPVAPHAASKGYQQVGSSQK